MSSVQQSPPSKEQLAWMLIWSQLPSPIKDSLHCPLERQSPPSKLWQDAKLFWSEHFPLPILDCPQNPSLIGDSVCDYANHNTECNFDGGDCSQCMTNAGASPNSKCIFPVIYQGKIFTSCTRFDDPDDVPWCSTLVDENGRHVSHQGKWGYCGSRCPIPSCGETHSEPWVPKLIKC